MTTEQNVADQMAVIEATIRMLWHADRREWERVEEVLAEEVTLDYTSLNGGEPATLARDQVVSAWAGLLGSLDATQHLVANHLVDIEGDEASCTAAFQATHLLGNPHGSPLWILGGHYEFRLARTGAGWRITSLQMTADWATGNQQIMAIAAEHS